MTSPGVTVIKGRVGGVPLLALFAGVALSGYWTWRTNRDVAALKFAADAQMVLLLKQSEEHALLAGRVGGLYARDLPIGARPAGVRLAEPAPSVASSAAPTAPESAAAAAPSPDAPAHIANAHQVLDAALAVGEWSPRDDAEFRSSLSDVAPSDADTLMRQLVGLFGRGKLRRTRLETQ